MIWITIIAILGYILIHFAVSMLKDEGDLQNQNLAEKFETITKILNQAAFNNQGKLYIHSKREFNLYKEGSPQIIHFNYGTGALIITWKYKFFQKEVVHEKRFKDARNLTIFEQEEVANTMIREMTNVIETHQKNIIGEI